MVEHSLENDRQEKDNKIARQKEDKKRGAIIHHQRTAEERKARKEEGSVYSMGTSASLKASEWEKVDREGRNNRDNRDNRENLNNLNNRGPRPPQTPDSIRSTPSRRNRWDIGGRTPAVGQTPSPQHWSESTPFRLSAAGETPLLGRKKMGSSMWDQPASATPKDAGVGATPLGDVGMMTPTPGGLTRVQVNRWERDFDDRNRPMTDIELDQILPSDGYEVSWGGGCILYIYIYILCLYIYIYYILVASIQWFMCFVLSLYSSIVVVSILFLNGHYYCLLDLR